jgi:hypothetical protein
MPEISLQKTAKNSKWLRSGGTFGPGCAAQTKSAGREARPIEDGSR